MPWGCWTEIELEELIISESDSIWVKLYLISNLLMMH